MLGVLLVMGVKPVFAEVDPTGADPSRNAQLPPPIYQVGACNVLWFGFEAPGEVARLQSLGLIVSQTQNPADLNPGNLAAYDVLVIAYTGPGVIDGARATISAFVAAENGLLIHQPNTIGVIDYAPAGLGATVASFCWCGGCVIGLEQATIVGAGHPITATLLNPDLPGDFDSIASVDGSYTVLARNIACPANPSVAAGEFGAGRVVLETANCAATSLDPGSNRFWANVFEWLCIRPSTPTDHTPWGRLKVLYR